MGKNVSIDSKNRIAIPTDYKSLDGKEVFYLLNTSKEVIGIYDISQYDDACSKTLESFKRSVKIDLYDLRMIQRTITAILTEVPNNQEMDNQRRFVLNKEWLEKLGIDESAYIEEVGEHIEISKRR